MAVLDLAAFQNKIQGRILTYTLTTTENMVSTRSLGGTVHTATNGVKLWTGSITFTRHTSRIVNRLDALLERVTQPGNFFLFTPHLYKGPANWTTQNFANVQTNGTQSVGYNLRLRNVPANFQFLAGDMLSFLSNGTHRLFRITSDVTAPSNGQVTVTINVPLSPSSLPTNATAVNVISPVCTMQYVPGSVQSGVMNAGYADGGAFQFIQALVAS